MNLRCGRETSARILPKIRHGENTVEEAMRLMLNEMEGRISGQISGFRGEFHDFGTEMKRNLNVVQEEVASLASKLWETTCRVADAEERINIVEERDDIVTEALSRLLQRQHQLIDRVEYFENKSCQLNIRIVKEWSEGNAMVGFFKTLF